MTVALKNNTPVVVPAAVLRRAGFRSGQELEVKASGGVITIAPKRPITDDCSPEDRRAIDRKLAASDRDYREGRSYGPFRTAEEMAASIEQNIGMLRGSKRNAKPGR